MTLTPQDPETGADNDGIDIALTVAVRIILKHEQPAALLEWAQHSLPSLMPNVFADFDPAERPILAFWMGVSIWNATPLPGNGFRPRPLSKPSRNEACPCGSGRKFKQCCMAVAQHPLMIPTDALWPLILEQLDADEIDAGMQAKQIPANAVAGYAHTLMERGRSRQAVKLLDRLFATQLDRLDDRHEGMIDLYCDACDDVYSTNRKKLALLERVAGHRSAVLRSEAWQRLATIRHDAGDHDGCWDAFREAQRATPDHPALAVLELSLLTSEGREAQARERAKIWRRRLRRAEERPEGFAALLDRAAEDPFAAMAEALGPGLDPALRRLVAWLEGVGRRAVTPYGLLAIHLGEAGPSPSPGPVRSRDELEPFGEGEAVAQGPGHAATPESYELVAPSATSRVEAQWHRLAAIAKPFSTAMAPFADDAGLAAEPDTWLGFLEAHPQAADSFDILDDVAALADGYENLESLAVRVFVMRPLLARAAAILDASLAAGGDCVLSWLSLENRPALRLLARSINLALDLHDDDGAARLMTRLLALNPADNHGYRALLVNHLLREGDDEAALALCRRYPDDMLPQTAYGRVLALYRAGDDSAARDALRQARAALPKVVPYLTRKNPRRPELSAMGITLGGDDQAWYYREEMRETWAQTPGALAFVRNRR